MSVSVGFFAPMPAYAGSCEILVGSVGVGGRQFNRPNEVAVDSSGNIYVADTENNRIQKFDSSGTFITKWGVYRPYGVAVDSSGNVYVAETFLDRIQKFDSDGTFITKWGSSGSGDGQFDTPMGIAVDSSGNVYVSDMWNYRIQKFTSSGAFLTKWGSSGSGEGQFSRPSGVAVDSSGYVYVADRTNHRIQKFDSSGNFEAEWGSLGSGDGQFARPGGVAVDSSGNIYVADTYNNRIQKLDSSGAFVTEWGSLGSGDGQFRRPNGVAVDSSGNVFVADTENSRINLITCDTQLIVDADGDGSPSTEDCDDDDTVYPGAPELCDGKDNDCNEIVDDILNTFWVDGDSDGYGDPAFPVDLIACSTPIGYSDNSDDCNDSDGAVHPGADELCDGIDNDCDGAVDEGLVDSDSDGECDTIDPCPFDAENDADKDGVCGDVDNCPGTPGSEVVNSSGCSIGQQCSIDYNWKNHGEYVSCVSHAAEELLAEGKITEEEKDAIVSSAAGSSVGKPSKRNSIGKGRNK